MDEMLAEFNKEEDTVTLEIKPCQVKIEGVKPEIKTEVKSEVKSEIKNEIKQEVKTELKTEVKQEVKTEIKSEIKSEPGIKLEVKLEQVDPESVPPPGLLDPASYPARCEFWRAQCTNFMKKKMTWAPLRPCCLPNYYKTLRSAPDRTTLVPCIDVLTKKEKKGLRRYMNG